MWQCGLIYKLYQTKLDPGLVHIVNSYLNDRSAFVQVKNEKSYTFELKSGVPQGGNLSPLLFNVFINDAPENNNIELSQFADDIAAYSAHEITNVAIDDMTDYLAIMSEWLNLWFLSLNTKKCNAIVFNPDEPNPPSLNIQISNTPIPWSPDLTYLGVNLDSRLNWTKQIETSTKKANQKMGALKTIMNTNGIHLNTKLYKTLILPQILYGYPAWKTCSSKNINKLQVLQNRCLRTITQAPWYVRNATLHTDLEVKYISLKLNEICTKFFERTIESDNPIIKLLNQAML